MSEDREVKGYDHRSRVTGTSSGPNAETEHRDVASGDTEEHNEIRTEERGRTDGYGPRTHDDTRITRKEGPGRP